MVKVKCQLPRIFFSDIRSHLINIFHDLYRIFKYMRIDPLEKISLILIIAHSISYLIGRVDISNRNHAVRI